MKIVQLRSNLYPSPVHIGGGEVRLWNDFRTLIALGHEVHVLGCDPLNEKTEQLETMAASVHTLHSMKPPKWNPRYWVARGFSPETVSLALPDLLGLRSQVADVLDKIRPDLIWAQGAQALLLCNDDAPIVHAQLDFRFKLRQVRRQSYGKRLRRPDILTPRQLKKLEIDVCRRAAFNLCASQSEADYLNEMGIEAMYLPVAGEPVPTPNFDNLSSGRLFLFGNPNTAMRAARHNLKTAIWPVIEREGLTFDWHQVGKVPRPGGDPSWPWIKEHFTVHGYVPAIEDLFLPGDASIMPYPFDTGGRAKFALCAGYGMVNIAYEETFRCASEFTHGQDCLAADSPEHFAELLRDFCADAALRRRLSEGSRAVYERHHTMEAQLPEYERILETALAAS